MSNLQEEKQGKTRFNFSLDGHLGSQIDEMIKLAGLSSKTEFFRIAATFLSFYCDVKREGKELILRDRKNGLEREIIIDFPKSINPDSALAIGSRKLKGRKGRRLKKAYRDQTMKDKDKIVA